MFSKIDLAKFELLAKAITDLRVLEAGESPPPVGLASGPKAEMIRELIGRGAASLPVAYREAYVRPVRRAADHLARSGEVPADVALNVETLVGPIYQHSPDDPMRDPVRQFLAVVSNYYRSFLSKPKREALGLPLATDGLPPLVTFRHLGNLGPFTYPSDIVRRLCGASVAVVSLPQRLARHPAMWLTVAHETTGHDVLHADPTLLPDLVVGIRSMFGGGPLTPGKEPDDEQLQALLWSYWLDEVASDVYALLNTGPAFAYNLAAFLAGLRGDHPGVAATLRRRESWLPLDVHPTLALRLHVAVGVVENLSGLAPGDRRRHIANFLTLAAREATPRRIEVKGRVEVESDRWVEIDRSVPFADLARAARRVGGYVATTRHRAFGDRSVQEIETWDSADEAIALQIAIAFADPGRSPDRVKILGDDAQLLAGAMLALLHVPEKYADINAALGLALSESFRHDPILGFARPEPAFDLPEAIPPRSGSEDNPRIADAGPGVGGPPEATPAGSGSGSGPAPRPGPDPGGGKGSPAG